MQKDFHYYACYCAAIIAGYDHSEAVQIAYSNQFVDICTKTLLEKLKGPGAAATTQSQAELINARTDIVGLQDITRIWASFHFLPYDLKAPIKGRPLLYKNKYRLVCDSNGQLTKETVDLAKNKGLQAAGIAMHVLSDTWAHKYFAGTPSLVINNTDYIIKEIFEDGRQKEISFRHSVTSPDDVENSEYTNSMYQGNETSIMNLGHGRMGHLPDYSFAKYSYLPAWDGYKIVIKDNPTEYMNAFAQMVYALRYLRGEIEEFELEQYEFDLISQYKNEIDSILKKRQAIACNDWKTLGKSLSGKDIPDFDERLYQDEYLNADKKAKDQTFLGKFFLAAMSQKSMVTHEIFTSGNLLAGFSVDYEKSGFRGLVDYRGLVDFIKGNNK